MMLYGILGGGPSGLGLQRFLKHDSEILEKEDRIGGLCRSFSKDGFIYDIGGHIIFSKHKEYMDLAAKILRGNLNKCRRANVVLFKDRYVKYPFENGLGVLDKQDIFECLNGYFQNNHPKPKNFKEWMYYTFGDGITEKYLLPYNEKIWKYPAQRMSMDWVERIPKPPVEDLLRSAVGIETEGYLHQLYFKYPTRGGFESMPKALQKKGGKVSTFFTARRIRRKGKVWTVSDGTSEKRYDRLVSTIPLNELAACLDGVPAKVREVIKGLRYNSLRIVMIGVDNMSLMDKSAIYIPDPTVLPHRVCYMGYFSRRTCPRGKSSLIAEISTFKNDQLYKASDASVIARTVSDLDRVGIIRKRDVVATDLRRVEYGYVVYDLSYQHKMKIIRNYFASIGIELLGRFAEFQYINSDQAVVNSIRMAERLNRQK